MKAKSKGSRLERQLKHKLEALGYAVTRSAASLGPFDLICMNRHRILLIQCKANRITAKERQKIELFRNLPENAAKIIAIKPDRKQWTYDIYYKKTKFTTSNFFWAGAK